MKGFLRKLSNATTDEDFGIKRKTVKMYNIIVTFKFLSTGNSRIVSSDRYFTNEDQAKKFCRIMNESCKKSEADHEVTVSLEYDYDKDYLMIYDYFD